jgi:hypothetical protein
MKLRTLMIVVVSALGGLGAHRMQVSVDEVRRVDGPMAQRVFMPSPEAMRVASLGYGSVVADLFWVRSVLLFVDFLEKEEPEDAIWLHTILKTVGTLDPLWRTPFFYGGGMLRLLSDVDRSDDIYEDGMASFPEDPFFPFSIAMNAYLYRDDLDRVVSHLKIAAALPTAPKWYQSAAAGFINKKGERRAALKYVREQIEYANSDREREILEQKYRSLLYDEIVVGLEASQERWEASENGPMREPEALGELPPDPLGGEWIIAPDGKIRSSIRETEVAKRAKNAGRTILVNP